MESKTYREIHSQYSALNKTYELLREKRQDCQAFFEGKTPEQIVVVGCGSSFHLSESVAMTAQLRTGVASIALAGGDLMLHLDSYAPLFSKKTLIITLSRSGSTSEVLYSVRKIKERWANVSVCTIACTEGSLIAAESDFVLELPWAFDESVCQTRSVTNLYAAAMLFLGAAANDSSLFDSYALLCRQGDAFLAKAEESVKDLGAENWTSAAVLSDGEGFGVAAEAALAFNEIAYTSSTYKHVLDTRHGPIVLFDKQTLVILRLDSDGLDYQQALVQDILKKGSQVVVVSDEELPALEGVRAQISLGSKLHGAAVSTLLLPVAQLLSYYHALAIQADPDQPDGLDAWIKL